MTTINALTDLETLEVSLVKRGANKKMFALAKSEDAMNGFDDVLKAVLETETDDEGKIAEAFGKDLSERGVGAVKGALRLLSAFKDELPQDVIARLAKIAGEEGEDDEEEKPAADDPAEKQEGEDYEYDSPTEKTMKTEELPEGVRADVEKLFKSHKDAVEKAAKLEELLQAERGERIRRDFVAKAEKQFGAIPGKTAAEIGLLLKSVHDVDAKAGEQLEELLTAANDVIAKSGLLAEAGSSKPSNGNAWERIEAIAKGIRDADPKVSVAKSMDLAMNQNPELYAEYAQDNPRQFGR